MKKPERNAKCRLFLFIAVALVQFFSLTPAQAQQATPNGTLAVAYQQRMDGELSKSVHHVQLECWDGECSLTTLTLNQCMELADGRFFYPKVERTSTSEGNLTVTTQSGTVLVAEEKHPETMFRFRFEYAIRLDDQLSKTFGLRSNKFFRDIISFSGAAVKNSTTLGQVISWDLVPLQGRSPKMKLDCSVMLDGIPDLPR